MASDCTTKDGHSLFLGTGTTGTTNIHITNLTTEGTPGSIVNCVTNQSGNVYLTGCHIGAIANNVLQVGGAGTWRMEEASSYAPSGQWALLTYQTPNVSLSGTDIKLDMGANAGAWTKVF